MVQAGSQGQQVQSYWRVVPATVSLTCAAAPADIDLRSVECTRQSPRLAGPAVTGSALDQAAGDVLREGRVERRVAAVVEDVEAADAQPLVVRQPLQHVLRLILRRAD